MRSALSWTFVLVSKVTSLQDGYLMSTSKMPCSQLVSQLVSDQGQVQSCLRLSSGQLKKGTISFLAVHLILGCRAVSIAAAAEEVSQLRPPQNIILTILLLNLRTQSYFNSVDCSLPYCSTFVLFIHLNNKLNSTHLFLLKTHPQFCSDTYIRIADENTPFPLIDNVIRLS